MHSFKFVAALQVLSEKMRSNRCVRDNESKLDLAKNDDNEDNDDDSDNEHLTKINRESFCSPISGQQPQNHHQRQWRLPVTLLRVEERVGHGLGKGTGKAISELVDIFSFI